MLQVDWLIQRLLMIEALFWKKRRKILIRATKSENGLKADSYSSFYFEWILREALMTSHSFDYQVSHKSRTESGRKVQMHIFLIQLGGRNIIIKWQRGTFGWPAVFIETLLAAPDHLSDLVSSTLVVSPPGLKTFLISAVRTLIMKLSVFLFEIGPGCICIVWANRSWDEPGLWCLCLRGSVINGTAPHCLGGKCLGWQNTLLITSEARPIQSLGWIFSWCFISFPPFFLHFSSPASSESCPLVCRRQTSFRPVNYLVNFACRIRQINYHDDGNLEQGHKKCTPHSFNISSSALEGNTSMTI